MNQISGWVEQAQTGNRFALNQLIDHFQTEIFRLVYYRVHHRADAEDLTQEIFMKMIRRIRSLTNRTQFKPWLYKIALNHVRDHFRKKHLLFFLGTTSDVESENEPESESDSPESAVFRQEFMDLLKSLSNEFSRWERDIFLLRFVNDMDIKDIAVAVGKNESTVKTHLYRALKKFKKHRSIREFLQQGKE